MNKVTFKVSQEMTILCNNKSGKGLSGIIDFEGKKLKYKFIPDKDPYTLIKVKFNAPYKYYYSTKGIKYESELNTNPRKHNRRENLKRANFAIKANNFLVCRFKRFAEAKHMRIIVLNETKPEHTLRTLDFEIHSKGKVYKPYKNDILSFLEVINAENPKPFLIEQTLIVAKEYLGQETNLLVENELKVSASEKLDRGELRIALLEAVICLEITVMNYLRKYYDSNDDLKDKFGGYLGNTVKALNLSSGIFLLFITKAISETYLKEINLDLVRETIDKRNKIMHEGDTDVPVRYKKNIQEVLNLSSKIISAKVQLDYGKERKEIESLIKQKIDKPMTIWIKMGHEYTVQILLFESNNWTEADYLSATKVIIGAIESLDNKFSAKNNLLVRFKNILNNEDMAFWVKGKLRLFPKNIEIIT